MKGKKSKSKQETTTKSAIESKHRRNAQRLLKSANRYGSEVVKKAKEKILRYDTAIQIQDEDATLLALHAITSSLSTLDKPYVERGERDKQDRDRGNRVRTANYETRNTKIRAWFDEICQQYPDELKKQWISRLQAKIVDYVNWAIADGGDDDEKQARNWFLSKEERQHHNWLISRGNDLPISVTADQVLTPKRLGDIISKNIHPTASC